MASLISTKRVNGSGPIGARILAIGEAPGYEEDIKGVPFVGDAGELFDNFLGSIGIPRETVRVDNCCQYRPNNNKFDVLLNSPELREGIGNIQKYIREQKPEWVLLLGSKPLEFIAKRKNIEAWRGSVIELEGTKYFAMRHPSAVLHDGSLYAIAQFDFQKFERYLKDGYKKPKHEFTIDPVGEQLELCLQEIEKYKRVTVDLEGVKGSKYILCCGFGLSYKRAICIFNRGIGDISFWSAIARILENPKIEKIFQNGFGYDIECLRLNGINVENYSFDTMIAAHVLEPEMPYGLDYLTSVYTDEPYYKDKGRSAIPDDEDKGWNPDISKDILGDYNCCDCIVDLQIADKQTVELTERGLWDTYNYKHSLIPLGLELTTAGLPIDEERKQLLKEAIKGRWRHYQSLLNTLAGFPINVKSPGVNGDVGKLLLGKYKLPERRHPKTKQITFDEDALVSYISFCQDKINEYKTQEKRDEWEFKLGAVKCILLIRGYRQLISNYINIRCWEDGRIHSFYNFSAATETGRGSSHKYFGTGNNAQTWPREVFEISDEEYQQLMGKINA